jgi:hypothetical protein
MKTRLIFIAVLAIAGYVFWSYAGNTLGKERCLNSGGQWSDAEKSCSI